MLTNDRGCWLVCRELNIETEWNVTPSSCLRLRKIKPCSCKWRTVQLRHLSNVRWICWSEALTVSSQHITCLSCYIVVLTVEHLTLAAIENLKNAMFVLEMQSKRHIVSRWKVDDADRTECIRSDRSFEFSVSLSWLTFDKVILPNVWKHLLDVLSIELLIIIGSTLSTAEM